MQGQEIEVQVTVPGRQRSRRSLVQSMYKAWWWGFFKAGIC